MPDEEATVNDYPPPVAALLDLGEIEFGDDWIDYPARGLRPEHVPDLIRLASTYCTGEEDFEEAPAWGPIHAWRALGQLRAAEAAEVLLGVVRRELLADGDMATEDMPEVFGLIGPATLPALAATLRDPDADLYLRWNAASGIAGVGQRHPEARAECVGLLVGQLENTSLNDSTLNAALIGCLMDLNAVEAADAIERAFATGHVDESIVGDWPDVRYELGLGPEPDRRVQRSSLWGGADLGPRSPGPGDRAKQRSRKKKKQAKQSRKRNRKKK
jgi:hypothetical protein